MKFFKAIMIALVAASIFTSCSHDGHSHDHDHSKESSPSGY